MSIAAEYDGYDPDNLLIDREEWEIHFQDILEKSPEVAEGLARVSFYLLQAIKNDPEGSVQACNSLMDGIEWAYLFTDAHKAAFKLFLLSIEGNLRIPDEPVELIGGAVKRGIEIAKKNKRRRLRKGRDL
ncbi:MAG TPA: hypothetical protein VEZ90_05440 [Blastocatellia bacterium]|nr:hypothetical protein [Blastocatellia bacterium]